MQRSTLFIGVERDRTGRQIHPEIRAAALQSIRSLAAETFGGYTLFNGEGGWVDPRGKLVVEGVVKLDVFTALPTARVDAFARTVGEWLNQESILVETLGAGRYVAPYPSALQPAPVAATAKA